MPPTTDEAMKRTDENFSAWSDFKEWMDVSYAARAEDGQRTPCAAWIRKRTSASAAARCPAGAATTTRGSSQSLTAIEPYDIGNNIEILRSLNPRMAVLTTSFAHGPWEKHRVWYEAAARQSRPDHLGRQDGLHRRDNAIGDARHAKSRLTTTNCATASARC